MCNFGSEDSITIHPGGQAQTPSPWHQPPFWQGHLWAQRPLEQGWPQLRERNGERVQNIRLSKLYWSRNQEFEHWVLWTETCATSEIPHWCKKDLQYHIWYNDTFTVDEWFVHVTEMKIFRLACSYHHTCHCSAITFLYIYVCGKMSDKEYRL